MPRHPTNPLRNARPAWEQATLSGSRGGAAVAVSPRGSQPGPAGPGDAPGPMDTAQPWDKGLPRGVTAFGARGWFSANRDPNLTSMGTDTAGSAKLTVSISSRRVAGPSWARGSHGLQKGRALDREQQIQRHSRSPRPAPLCLALSHHSLTRPTSPGCQHPLSHPEVSPAPQPSPKPSRTFRIPPSTPPCPPHSPQPAQHPGGVGSSTC